MPNYKTEKEIDLQILNDLIVSLDIDEDMDYVNIVSQDFIKSILKSINLKKEAISLLFKGDFSKNEHILRTKLSYSAYHPKPLTVYDNIANNIILKKIKSTFETLIEENPKNNMKIAVYTDRQLFLEKLLSENIQPSFIKKCIEQEEISK